MRGQSLRRRALCLALVAASVAPISLAIFSSRASGAATTWYASVAGSGTTCTTSSPCALTEALSSATFGDTVDLAPGTYEPATSFTISTSITLQPTTPGTSVILTGNDATVLIVDPSVVATISGISIENGTSYAEAGGIDNQGAAIIDDCTISNNDSITGGGGISNGGAAIIEDSSITDNGSYTRGGGISNGGTATIEDSTISNNGADSGGGIESSGPSLAVESSTISGNSVQAVGAGIDTQSTTTVQNSTISGNYAGEDGGGITSSEALTVEDSTVSGNGITTLFGGTGGISSGGSATIEDSTISGNLGATEGGGISNGGTATIQDSTLSGNSALNGGGGGIFNQGTAIVENSTIAGNGLDDSGGAVGGISNAGTVRMQATIVASNGPSHDCYGDITDLGYNIDDDGTCGFTAPSISDSTTIDSTLAPIANNGGPTETIALLSGSPAIGQIPAAECPTTDQRGYRRIPPCDIGAFQVDARAVAPTTTTVSTVPTLTALDSSVAYTAEVAPSSGSGLVKGTVTFTTGSQPLCTATLLNGVASCSASTAPLGLERRHGQLQWARQIAASLGLAALSVVLYPTTTDASVNPTRTTTGSSVSYSVSVSATAGPGPPSGFVDFSIGSTALCTVTLLDGAGSCDASNAPPGIDTVTAAYNGDSNFDSSTDTTTLTVTNPTPSVDCSELSGTTSTYVTFKQCELPSKANKSASASSSFIVSGGTLTWSPSSQTTGVSLRATSPGQGSCAKNDIEEELSGIVVGGTSAYTQLDDPVSLTMCVNKAGRVSLVKGTTADL